MSIALSVPLKKEPEEVTAAPVVQPTQIVSLPSVAEVGLEQMAILRGGSEHRPVEQAMHDETTIPTGSAIEFPPFLKREYAQRAGVCFKGKCHHTVRR